MAAAEGSKIDPMHQFLIEPVMGSHWVVGGYDLSFTNSALWMVVTLASLAAFMIGGTLMGRAPLKALMGEAVHLPDAAWRTLTLRYGAYFAVAAIANQAVIAFTDRMPAVEGNDLWVKFRIALLPLAVIFSLTQVPFMMKHMAKGDEVKTPEPPDAGF